MGALTHSEEGHLFKADYAAWCTYVAPRWVVMLQDRDAINRLWPIASETLRRAVWAAADARTRELIQRSRAGIATNTGTDNARNAQSTMF